MIIVGMVIIIATVIAWKWVNGIDYMKDFESDYNGEDFL